MPFELRMSRDEYKLVSRLKSSANGLRQIERTVDRSQQEGLDTIAEYADLFVQAYDALVALESDNRRVRTLLAAYRHAYTQHKG